MEVCEHLGTKVECEYPGRVLLPVVVSLSASANCHSQIHQTSPCLKRSRPARSSDDTLVHMSLFNSECVPGGGMVACQFTGGVQESCRDCAEGKYTVGCLSSCIGDSSVAPTAATKYDVH